MADQVINQHGFPVGTAVSVYPMENWPERSSQPSGTAVASGTVDSLGGLIVSGAMDTGRRYVAFAPSQGRGVTFLLQPGSLDLEAPARKKDIAALGGVGPPGPIGPAGPPGPEGGVGPAGLTW